MERDERRMQMNVGVLALRRLIPNHAMMVVAAHHRAQGDTVEIAAPLAAHTYDKVYVSKPFLTGEDDQTPWPCEVVRGGAGYDLTARLPEWADTTYPAYDLYGCTYALGRITRGCPRGCPYCLVGRMDGTRVHQVAELDDFWHGQEVVRLLDDNLTAIPDLFVAICDLLASERVRVMFEALDVRLMTADMARSLARVRRQGQVHFAFDNMKDEAGVRRGIAALKDGGFPLSRATFYVLTNYGTTMAEDAYRVDLLDSLGVESFVMLYDKDHADHAHRSFARMTNRKEIFRTTHPRRRAS